MDASNCSGSFSWDIPPFYDPAKSSVAPQTSPRIPLAQTEIALQQPHILLATQEIGPRSLPGPDRHHRDRIRYDGPSSSSKSTPARNHATATKRKSSPEPSPGSESEMSQYSGYDSDDDELIPKPAGEVGRPGRGGYNLKDILDWKDNDYRRCKKFVQAAVLKHLDPSTCFSEQPTESLKTIQTLATERFPILRDYADCWLVSDFIRSVLHYTCRKARMEQHMQDAAIGKAVKAQAKKTKKK